MTIPYRTRRLLTRIATVVLVLALAAAAVWALWIVWLNRYVVYTRDGAKLNFTMPLEFPQGEVAAPPTAGDTISIYYNDGENSLTQSTELTTLNGYYVDGEALKDIPTVLSRLKALPSDTTVMVDMKSIAGYFYYKSSLGPQSEYVDATAMEALMSYLKNGKFYTIARIPAFQEYYFPVQEDHVEYGLFMAGGYGLWMDDQRCYWLNPASDGSLTFLIQIIQELRDLGFDEVVLDNFRFPDTQELEFSGDRTAVLTKAAQTLASACCTERFALSFQVEDAAFPLPAQRCRMYLKGVEAGAVDGVAAGAAVTDPLVELVFLTQTNDTRYNAYSVLRPLDSAVTSE